MDELEIEWLGGHAPVQAEGTVAGRRFYFRARYEHWTFSLSENPEIPPVDVDSPEAGKAHGYFAEGSYGSEPFAASWMDHQEARKIIERCAADYLAQRTM